jgi:type I restriction enzyme, S subunit
MSNLPEGWALTDLRAVIDRIEGGGTPSKANPNYFSGSIPFMTVKDLTGRWILDTQDHITQEAVHASATRLIPKDTLIIATRMSLGKIARPLMDVAINQDLKALHLTGSVDKTFIEYWWKSREALIQAMGKGTTVKGIRLENILAMSLLLPPLNEQKRIADKLDFLLGRVDACRERLERVPALLKRFRQSVLAAAVSGKLTEDWRADKGLDKSGWQDTTVGECLIRIDAGLNVMCEERPPNADERGLVKISAVSRGKFNEEQSKTLPKSTQIKESSKIQSGDLLISRANTIELVGACVIVEQVRRNLYLSDKVLRLASKEGYKEWLFLFLSSPAGRQQIEDLSSGNQLSMRNISQSNLKSIFLSIPPAEERIEIANRVDKLLNLETSILNHSTQVLTSLISLGPSILSKAFRGELVPQDPKEEPAKMVLTTLAASQRDQGMHQGGRAPGVKPQKSKQGTKSSEIHKSISEILKSGDRNGMEPQQVLQAAGYTSDEVEQFYVNLSIEVKEGRVKEKRQENGKILLVGV